MNEQWQKSLDLADEIGAAFVGQDMSVIGGVLAQLCAQFLAHADEEHRDYIWQKLEAHVKELTPIHADALREAKRQH